MKDSELQIAPLFHIGPLDITSTVVTTWAIMLAMFLFSWLATRRLRLDPGLLQTAIETQAEKYGVKNAFDFPGFVPAYIRPLFCVGKGPFRWVALSGDPEDIYRTDEAVAALFPEDEHLHRWLRMAYCTSCLDGPVDMRWVVLQWGTAAPGETAAPGPGAETMVVSGGILGEDELEGRPAILAVPIGEGVVVTYNFNPMHRDLNRSDERLLWNAILNWRSLSPG